MARRRLEPTATRPERVPAGPLLEELVEGREADPDDFDALERLAEADPFEHLLLTLCRLPAPTVRAYDRWRIQQS